MSTLGDRGVRPEPDIIQEIVTQHAEEAAFLWRLRDAATEQPHYASRHLAQLDGRVEAHLDGLRVAAGSGFKIAWAQVEQFGGFPGEIFPVATLALEDRSAAAIDPILGFAEQAPASWRGLFGAVGWISADALRGQAVTWLDSRIAFRRLLGVVACSLHRADPRSRLAPLLDDELLIRRRALRLVGELGRIDLGDRLRPALSAEDDGCRFWAAWSQGLIGNRLAAVPVLQAFAAGEGPFKWRALDLVVRLMDRETVIAWFRQLAHDPAHARLVVVGAGVLGDPVVVPWLTEKMSIPNLARVAGESFSMITGIDLSESKLDAVQPEGFTAGPTDDPGDENVSIDRDENLPWPDSAKVQVWWRRESTRFPVSVRHLRGAPLTRESCEGVFREGYQRQRRAAAYELALLSPGSPLQNWRARLGR
jgi:uncharacterized protein (TIGR02270 family)